MSSIISQDRIVNEVIKKVGKNIVLAAPLGAGKPNHLLNAFYDKAIKDPDIHLTIYTALTLQRPVGKSDLENRFIHLFDKRLFKDYPDFKYEKARMNGGLPKNIKVIEFYFAPGKYIGKKDIQRNYISSNYTHIVRDAIDRNINVVAQMVAKREVNGETKYSLSCNPDITVDIAQILEKKGEPYALVAQVNQNMPYMYGDAEVEEKFFDFVMDDPDKYFAMFGTPKMSVSETDYMIGIYCSSLIKDDGEIQIGIGSLGDSTIYNLLLRQKENEVYQEILKELKVEEKFPEVMQRCSDTGIFKKGLFGASEMIGDGFKHLYENEIIKKKAYDHIGLQRLLNADKIKEKFDDDILEILWRNKIIHEKIAKEDFDFLQHWGILREGLKFIDNEIRTPDGQFIDPHIGDYANLQFIKDHCLGTQLKNGKVMHGGFFLGPQSFYEWLKNLPEEERKLIHMRSISKINQLYGHEELDRLHRKNARFVNSCMMYTLGGAAVSDGLQDGKVVSGVGGQYNFVAMAQELPDGHSVLNLKSTRTGKEGVSSNIVPYYGHITIPRHLRDIVVTEYGIAMIRGKTDQEIIQELLKITDSRFQEELMVWAKKTGKLNPQYQIPEAYRNNTPESYKAIIRKYKQQGYFPVFPFGTELTDEELKLGKALKSLKADSMNRGKLLSSMFKSFFTSPGAKEKKYLGMLGLDKPKNLKERIFGKLITAKLKEA